MKNRRLTISEAARAGRLWRATPHASAALLLAVFLSTPAFPEDRPSTGRNYQFEFTNIADSTNGFVSFGVFPAINNRGEVAFNAVRADGGAGVFRSRDSAEKVAVIASLADGLSQFGDDVALNSAGVVAFTATTASSSRAIFKGDGASRTLIADSAANGLSRIGLGSPAINPDGIVAFFSLLAQRGSPQAIFTSNGGPLRTLAATSPAGFTGFGNAAINASGTVVFPATLAGGNRGVFTIAGSLVDVVDTGRHPEIDSFGDPVINDAGTVADVAFVLPFDAPQIFTANASAFTPRNNPANPAFAGTEHPSLNNHNAVAFAAILVSFGSSSPTGIFLEVSGGQFLIPVVAPGDPLFGSTVDHVDLGRFALNERFQMAFSYTLKDGRSGVAIASFDGERQ